MNPENDRAPGTEQGTEGGTVITPTTASVACGPVIPYRRRRPQLESEARLAGELAAARLSKLEPLRLTERCHACQAASIEWLRWAGRRYGGCPHGIGVAS